MYPSVAIIIVTYDGERYIKKCLSSVLGNSYEGKFDIFVIDNNSKDKTAEIVSKEFSNVVLDVLKGNLGFAGGNNFGIRKALSKGYDYIVLLNQDTEVSQDWLSELSRVAQKYQEAGIVQSMLLLSEERALTNNAGNAFHYLGFGFIKNYRQKAEPWVQKGNFEIGYASGAAMLIKKEVLERIGAFDEKFFMYHEDLDLCWRARIAGYKIIVAAKSIVFHDYEFNRNKMIFYWTERARIACLAQNYSFASILKLLPIFLLVEAMMIFYSLLNGWAVEKLNSYVWFVSNISMILKSRRCAQSTRKVSDKEIFKSMDYNLEFSGPSFAIRWIVNPIICFYYYFIKIFI